ncbi:MAG: ImmA/IrrE family metallo-endopeptidase [Clostridiaceae bacterium]
MDSQIELNEKDIFEICELVNDLRGSFRTGDAPIGPNIFKLVQLKDIRLVFYPIKDSDKNNFSAVYVSMKNQNKNFDFIGLNTNDYLDDQIFSLAHELYHYKKRSSLHFYRDTLNKVDKEELMAERFAAELLLPKSSLEDEIRSINNGSNNLKQWEYKSILMFIARLHTDYRIPYKAIVKRLYELGFIDKSQYTDLYKEKNRKESGLYYTIGINVGDKEFRDLNTYTKTLGVYKNEIENIIRDYDSDTISLPTLKSSLEILGKKLEDFGLQENVDNETLDEFDEIFKEYTDGKETK